MSKYFSVGDLVRLPQGTILWVKERKLDAHYPDGYAIVFHRELRANTMALYGGSHEQDWSKIIIDGVQYLVENADIFEGDTYVSTIN